MTTWITFFTIGATFISLVRCSSVASYPRPIISLDLNQSTVISGRRSLSNTDTLNIYQRLGTHYTFLWVGSPVPHKVSVIIDTGSHRTAFPCLGCDCGQHVS